MIPAFDGTCNLIVVYSDGGSIKIDNARVFEGDWSVQIETEKDVYIINKENILFIRAEKR